MRPEEKARRNIDQLLELSGWEIQDYKELNLAASLGVAIREFPLGKDHADYALFVDRRLAGVIEAKPEGTTLSGVAEQSQTYLTGISKSLQGLQSLPPFAYETTGIETFFRDLRDPDTRSRRVFAFHKPETLCEWMSTQETVRTNLKKMNLEHPLILDRLRDCQIGAIKNLEKSFANCGTGGFILATHDYISRNYNLDKEQKKFLRFDTFKGWDIVDDVARLLRYCNSIISSQVPVAESM